MVKQPQHKQFSNSSSLVARAGQFMAVIIALGMLSMIASMLVAESLSGDAAQINLAGSLRMQAIRISRAHLADNSQDHALINQENVIFEQKLKQLFAGGIVPNNQQAKILAQYQKIAQLWQPIKQPETELAPAEVDAFVTQIEQLVSLLQQASEKKLRLLRLIQGISLFALLILTAYALIKLNRTVIVPLKELVDVASAISKGNFEHPLNYQSDNELGVLAQTINQMSSELKTTYRNFEQRVQQKTEALSHSNQSLELLFRSARKLTSHAYQQANQQIITDLEQVLGSGKVTIELIQHQTNEPKSAIILSSPLTNNSLRTICFNQQKFPLEKQNQLFGYLVWHYPSEQRIQSWQKHMLQALADMLATTIKLEQQRHSENRLLIMEERAVIARELHDSLAQSLSYLKLQVSLLERKIAKHIAQQQVDETIADIKSGLARAYQQLRELLTTFRLKLDDPSIEHALKGTIAEFSTKCQFPIALEFQLPRNFLCANQEIHMLQIIREALSNIHRHAMAQQAGVAICQQNAMVTVTIWDDGIGLAESYEQAGHFGLNIMAERAKSLGTKVNVADRQPQGTQITFSFRQEPQTQNNA
jgi:two-component system, NarL family, nitrate/nitrite sensor histidine kinase NarX